MLKRLLFLNLKIFAHALQVTNIYGVYLLAIRYVKDPMLGLLVHLPHPTPTSMPTKH